MKAWTAVKAGIFVGMTVAMLFHWHVEAAKAEPLAIVATSSVAAPAENIYFAERIPSGHWVDMGTFKTTGFCGCRTCNGKWAGTTATGVVPEEGVTVAVDKSVIPLGSMVMVDGRIYWAQDTGVRGKHIDVYYKHHGTAWNHGVQRARVFIWREDK